MSLSWEANRFPMKNKRLQTHSDSHDIILLFTWYMILVWDPWENKGRIFDGKKGVCVGNKITGKETEACADRNNKKQAWSVHTSLTHFRFACFTPTKIRRTNYVFMNVTSGERINRIKSESAYTKWCRCVMVKEGEKKSSKESNQRLWEKRSVEDY